MRRESVGKKGASPLSKSLPPLLEGEKNTKGESKRGEASLLIFFPLPFVRGEGQRVRG